MSNTTITGSTVTVTPSTSTGLTGASAGTIAVNTGTTWVTLGGGGGGGGGYTTGSTGPTYAHYVGATGASYSDYTQSDIVLRRPGKPDLKVGESLDLIMERLGILTPDMAKLEKYAALKKAYDHYKLIESLIQEEHKDGK